MDWVDMLLRGIESLIGFISWRNDTKSKLGRFILMLIITVCLGGLGVAIFGLLFLAFSSH